MLSIINIIPTFKLTKNPSTNNRIGINIAPALSGIKCATIICVSVALSSIIFLVFPEG